MGNNDNRVVTHIALNQFIIENGGSPKNNNANSYAIPFGEFNQYAPMYNGTNAGVVINDYTGIGGGAYSSNQLVIEKDVTWRGADAPVIVLPTGITVTPDATLNPGQTQQLTAVVLPANAADKSVTWSSENSSIAEVDQNGLVTARAVGVVKIYATSNADPNVSGYATITVVDVPVVRYNISWSGDHASIPGSTSPVTQNEGTSWNGTFVADNGYQIDSITYTGQNVSHSGNTVTVSDLRSDVSITVTTSQVVVPVNRYTISMVGEHVTASTTVPVTLDEGSTWSCTFTPEQGYQIDSITTEGNNVTTDGNTISVSNLTSNVVITITTSAIVTPTPTHTISWSGDHISIDGGATSPVTLNEGSTWTGTFTADEGYQIDSISTTGSTVNINENVVTVSSLDTDVFISISTSATSSQEEGRIVRFTSPKTYEVFAYDTEGNPVWYDGSTWEAGGVNDIVYATETRSTSHSWNVRPRNGYYITGVTLVEGNADVSISDSMDVVNVDNISSDLIIVRVDTRSTNTYSIVFEGDEHTLHTFVDNTDYADNLVNRYDGYKPGDSETIYLVPEQDYVIDLDSITIGTPNTQQYFTATTSVAGTVYGDTPYYKIELSINDIDAPNDGYEIFISAITDPKD